jgi:hypothetical protein
VIRHYPRIREIQCSLGLLVYEFRCSCGVHEFAGTEADIYRRHPVRQAAVPLEQRPMIRIVKVPA